MPRAYTPQEAAGILPLIGEHTVVLHAPDPGSLELSGRDIDCVVHDLDPMWPLRLPDEWRLCQQFNYDLRSWYSILERGGVVVHLDTIDDPRGLGRYGFPTDLLGRGGGSGPRPGVQAAYLAVKRLQKGDRSPREWARIGELAAADPDCLREVLAKVLGERTAWLIRRSCLEGAAPDLVTCRRVRSLRRIRRVRTPARAGRVLVLSVSRIVGRLRHPTGMSVLVVGPDGAGKSALAQSLIQVGQDLFRRQIHWHWRPQLLPRPATLLGREAEVDTSEPHGRPAHRRLVSAALVGYYWLDSLLGGLLWDRVVRVRSGLIVIERGWWDLLVDPARYRIRGGAGLARELGRFLPKPDLVLILDAPSDALLRRKAELSAEELERQTAAWKTALPRGVRRVRLDASRPFEQVGQEAHQAVVDLLEARAVARVGSGWARVPLDESRKVLLPRGPRRAAKAALRVRHPATKAEWAAWLATGCFVSLGGLRLLPSGAAPPRRLREALAPHLPPGGTVAVAAARDGSCWIASIVDLDGRSHAIAKVAMDDPAARAIDHEAGAIRQFGNLLRPPLSAPTLLAQEPGLLLLEAVQWRPRLRTVRLHPEVAWSLGAFFAAESLDGLGPAHGRLTPGNLLRAQHGWVLCDWSDASGPRPPFFDLVHYLVAVNGLAERPSRPGRRRPASWVHRAFQAYAGGAGISPSLVPDLVEVCRNELTATVPAAR
jgi:hypothetical protein